MSVIKNIHLLEAHLKENPELERKLEAGAELHLRHARIEFKILSVKGDSVTVRVTQGQSPSENYLTAQELSSRAKDLFAQLYPHLTIHARAIPYSPPKVEVVSPEWIQNRMKEKQIDNKTIVEMTGVDKANISNWVSGSRPMSQPVKAMFYFMLK
jgi:hypothetical protein